MLAIPFPTVAEQRRGRGSGGYATEHKDTLSIKDHRRAQTGRWPKIRNLGPRRAIPFPGVGKGLRSVRATKENRTLSYGVESHCCGPPARGAGILDLHPFIPIPHPGVAARRTS